MPQRLNIICRPSTPLSGMTPPLVRMTDTIAQPETTVAGQSSGCKHVVAPELPHASQKPDQTSKEQGEGDCDVGSGRLGPHSVGALQQTRHDVTGRPENSQHDTRDLSDICCGEAFARRRHRYLTRSTISYRYASNHPTHRKQSR